MRAYILSVCAAALIASILINLAGNGSVGKFMKMLSGLFLAVTVMAPLVHLELPDPSAWIEDFSREGREAAAEGEQMAREYSAAIISAEVEAYILDKASIYGAELMVDIEMGAGETPVPESIRIQGSISPYGRMQLQQLLTEEFGIPKEQQIWIG